jgi:glycosyltransferase involved in cell wall biosynthesis
VAVTRAAEASVIIAIYNKFEYLERVLAGLERQSVRGFEVVLADDGSNEDTVALIERYRERSTLPLRHVWQEDRGFRKTAILNQAVLAAQSEYLIFVDGDCVPHHRFVEAHLAHRVPGVALAGRRVELSQELTDWLTVDRIRAGASDTRFLIRVFWDSIRGTTRHAEKGIYLPGGALARLVPQSFKGLLGCNFSLHARDLLEINGFDERYQAPGAGEDTDLELRLEWAGKRLQSVKNYAVQYHLHHRLLDRSAANLEILAGVMAQWQPVTPCGIRERIAGAGPASEAG